MVGPADIPGGWAETQRSLAHGTIVFAAILALAHWAPRRPRAAGALALLLLSADLAVANARLIMTVPQAMFNAPSQAALLIEAAERSDPSPGPFRVHRMPGEWLPPRFAATHTNQRLRELIAWTRDTIRPPVAVPLGLDYCTSGAHGLASFRDRTKLIYPSAEVLDKRQYPEESEPWSVRQGWQLRRNLAVYPRAWVVHSARLLHPASDAATRARIIRLLTYMNDPIWNDADRQVLDLRQTAVIEVDDTNRLNGFISPTPVGQSESVAVVKHEPQRVELMAKLERPGLVILADTHYPGWRLTIDGKNEPIYRANRLMRAAAVLAGEHKLVYTYEPESFRAGLFVSTAGLIVMVAMAWSTRRIPYALPRDESSSTAAMTSGGCAPRGDPGPDQVSGEGDHGARHVGGSSASRLASASMRRGRRR
jgi:hypothetical protein